MNKVKLILDVAQLMLKVVHDLRTLSDSVQAVCNAVTEGLSEEQQPKAIEAKPALEEKPAISLEKVRSVLAEKSQAGHTAEVRAIIGKYGASRLSEIDAKNYAAVLKDTEELG
ncbi:MAG: rRNA biogenesis protein rrp5 [Ruminococcus sp.]